MKLQRLHASSLTSSQRASERCPELCVYVDIEWQWFCKLYTTFPLMLHAGTTVRGGTVMVTLVLSLQVDMTSLLLRHRGIFLYSFIFSFINENSLANEGAI
jgi:hypothetical protein